MFHWIFRIDQGVLPYGRKLLYYSYLVYCKPFNVLFRGSLARAAKNIAKLQVLFETRKFFAIFFSTFFRKLRGSPALAGPSAPWRDLRPKSECKVTPFPRSLQTFFQKKFIKTMFSSIYLTSVCNCQNCIPDTIFTQRPVYSGDKVKSKKTPPPTLRSR